MVERKTLNTMTMKKLMLLLLALLPCALGAAQMPIEVTTHGGEVVKGTSNGLFLFDHFHELRVKDEESGKKQDFTSEELTSVKLYDEESGEWITAVPLKAQRSMPSLLFRNPKPYRNPVFMIPLYEGKRVSAYKHLISTMTVTQQYQIQGGSFMLYFLVKGEDVCRAYALNNSVGAKAVLKLVFKDFPEMAEEVENMDSDKFYEDPLDIIKRFDEILSRK